MADGRNKALGAGWLATRLGIGSARIDVMRRSGKLLGVRPRGAGEYLYPSWQFGRDGKVLDCVPRLIQAARARGLRDERLYELMDMRVGTGGRRLHELARAGEEEAVLRALRTAAPTRGS